MVLLKTNDPLNIRRWKRADQALPSLLDQYTDSMVQAEDQCRGEKMDVHVDHVFVLECVLGHHVLYKVELLSDLVTCAVFLVTFCLISSCQFSHDRRGWGKTYAMVHPQTGYPYRPFHPSDPPRPSPSDPPSTSALPASR